MPYARAAGDYATARGRGDYARRSRGDLFGFLKSAVSKVGGAITGVGKAIGIPGMGIAHAVTQTLGSMPAKPPTQSSGTPAIPGTSVIRGISKVFPVPNLPMLPGGGRQIARDLGLTMAGRRRHRRINPGNAKAATRAIRRVKAARDLLRKIEAQMPTKRCGCGTKLRRK